MPDVWDLLSDRDKLMWLIANREGEFLRTSDLLALIDLEIAAHGSLSAAVAANSEASMLGMILTHVSGERGEVDAVNVDPAGRAMVRINDHWFDAVDCRGPEEVL